MKNDKEAILEEERRVRKLTRLVDFTAALLRQSDLALTDAQKLIAFSRERALELFPDKGQTFDLIYGPRFRRILAEKYHLV
jgi:hypothetical protein